MTPIIIGLLLYFLGTRKKRMLAGKACHIVQPVGSEISDLGKEIPFHLSTAQFVYKLQLTCGMTN
jgi:hypothetical protein